MGNSIGTKVLIGVMTGSGRSIAVYKLLYGGKTLANVPANIFVLKIVSACKDINQKTVLRILETKCFRLSPSSEFQDK